MDNNLLLIKAEEKFLLSNGWIKINKKWTPKDKKHFWNNCFLSRTHALEIVKEQTNFPEF